MVADGQRLKLAGPLRGVPRLERPERAPKRQAKQERRDGEEGKTEPLAAAAGQAGAQPENKAARGAALALSGALGRFLRLHSCHWEPVQGDGRVSSNQSTLRIARIETDNFLCRLFEVSCRRE